MTFAWEPAPVVGGAYSDDTKPWSVQDTVNWIPVQIERPGGRSDSLLRCAPGASVFCVPGPAAPVRGLHDVEGKLFAAVGTALYQITPTAVAIPRGTIPGVGRVSMAHNQIAGGNELVIANGQSGYVYNTSTETLAQITDDSFPGFKVCDYVDSYIVGVEPRGRFWLHSELADATSYNALDRAEAESQPDRIVTLVVSRREVFVLGERTGEFFRNAGTSTGTFQRADGTEMEVGCAAVHTVCRMDNSVFWLGHDGCVYRLNGYQPVRISTRPMEQAISRCNLAEAFAFTYEDRGHKIYYLTFPDGMTWGYDASSGEWARRQSFGLDRWRMNCMVRWNKQWIAGDMVNGKLYRIEWDTPWENGEVVERRRVTGVLHGNQNRITVDALELVFDTGGEGEGPGELNPPQPTGPSISGSAPDGLMGVAYAGYTYTVTPGTGAIVSTVITSGTLPDGLTWNPYTATISAGTPTEEGAFHIKLLVTDVNGLSAMHEDTIAIGDLVWNPADKTASAELINGTSTLTNSNPVGTNNGGCRSFRSMSVGKWYWEWKIDVLEDASVNTLTVGFGNANFPLDSDEIGESGVSVSTNRACWGWRRTGAIRGGTTINGPTNPNNPPVGPPYAQGDVLMVALDLVNNRCYFGKNGTFYRYHLGNTYPSDPAAGTGNLDFPGSDAYSNFLPIYAAANVRDNPGGAMSQITLRTKSADFDYTPPTGYTPLGDAP